MECVTQFFSSSFFIFLRQCVNSYTYKSMMYQRWKEAAESMIMVMLAISIISLDIILLFHFISFHFTSFLFSFHLIPPPPYVPHSLFHIHFESFSLFFRSVQWKRWGNFYFMSSFPLAFTFTFSHLLLLVGWYNCDFTLTQQSNRIVEIVALYVCIRWK